MIQVGEKRLLLEPAGMRNGPAALVQSCKKRNQQENLEKRASIRT